MTTTTDATLKVGMRQLRAALTAVVPHAEPTKVGDDGPSVMSRVRVVAAKDEVHVIAAAPTAGTTAMAAFTIDEDDRRLRFAPDDGPLIVDLAPKSVRRLLGYFKTGRATVDAEEQWAELHLDTAAAADGSGTLTVRDVSALFPGDRAEVTTLPVAADYPDVVSLIRGAVSNAAGDSKPLVARAAAFRLFVPASVAYDEALEVQPTGSGESRGFVVSCGPDFVGTLSSRHNDDDSLKRRDSYRRKHLARLGLGADLTLVG